MYPYIYCTIFPRYILSTEHRVIISEALHIDEFSRTNNADKTSVIFNNGIFPETGSRVYNLHEQRELYSRDVELLDSFTGLNRVQPNNPSPKNPAWTAVLEATTTVKRPNSIQGSNKTFRQCKCKCLKKMKVSVCLLPTCTRAQDAFRISNKNRKHWRQQSENWSKINTIEENRGLGMANEDIFSIIENNPVLYQCQSCNSAFRDGSVHSQFLARMSSCIYVLLCTKFHIHDLGLKMYGKKCEETGTIDKCMFYP